MATAHILVVDSDKGFGNMLKEGLISSGDYTAECVHSGNAALKALTGQNFDLVIIDMGLTDISPLQLVQAVRKSQNGIRVMMIPLIGQNLPKAVESLDINGVLTKPFFVGDLPNLIDNALGRRSRVVAPAPVETPPVSAPPTETEPTEEVEPAAEMVSPMKMTTVPQETISYLRANEAEILRLLDDLNREVRAEAILLIAGAELIAQAGMLGRAQCQKLTMLVAQSSQAAAQAATFLGEPAGRFAQSLHEGAEYRLYSLSLGEGILLSLALSSNIPLGMIRHQCRQIAERLSRFI